MPGAKSKGVLKLFLMLVTLVVPVIIFLFLKGFGVNHYTVPVFYAQGIPRDTSECQPGDQTHVINLSNYTFNSTGKNSQTSFNRKLSVIDIDVQSVIPLDKPGYPLNRVADQFSGQNDVQFILIRMEPESGHEKQSSMRERFKYIYGNKAELSSFARCELVLLDFPDKIGVDTRRFVLVDQHGRIRGYYPVSDFEEIDRMIVEMKIILKEEY